VTTTVDSVISAARTEITALDARLIAILNERVSKVEALRRYKAANGIDFIDHEREAALARYLKYTNFGPLSSTGVEEVVSFVLALVKRETSGG
jgi:chorismate mutase